MCDEEKYCNETNYNKCFCEAILCTSKTFYLASLGGQFHLILLSPAVDRWCSPIDQVG